MTLEKILTVKVPDALGDTVIADAFLQFLKENKFGVAVLAKNPELLENRGYNLVPANIDYNFDTNLNGYLNQLIHTSEPPKTIRWYMANHGIQQLREAGFRLPDFDEEKYLPKISLTPEEDEFGREEIDSLKEEGRAVVAISWESKTTNRTWPREYTKELFRATKDEVTYIEFVPLEDEQVEGNVIRANYSPRDTAAVLKHADGVISIDTFTIHAAAAVGQKKVIGLFGSSRPETVGYEGVISVEEKTEKCQYCGNHGYFTGNIVTKLEDEISKRYGTKMKFSNDGCVHSGEKAFICMEAITPGKIIGAVRNYFLSC